jgi:transposase
MKFISAHFDQLMLLPPDITEKIPKGHKCFFIRNIVGELDLSPLISEYSEEGRPAYHPEIILSLLFCAYTDGITSSRVIAQKTRTDVVYMYLAGMMEPDIFGPLLISGRITSIKSRSISERSLKLQ